MSSSRLWLRSKRLRLVEWQVTVTRVMGLTLSVLSIFLITAESLFAQNGVPHFSGIVLDKSGNRVPEAYVILFQGGNKTRTVLADSQGQFRIIGDLAVGKAVINTQRMGYLVNPRSRKEVDDGSTELELHLTRQVCSRGEEWISLQVGGGGFIASAVSSDNPSAISWKLEKRVSNKWRRIDVKQVSPLELLRYSFEELNLDSPSHVEYRLTATVKYEDGEEVASHRFLVSSQSRLIDGEP